MQIIPHRMPLIFGAIGGAISWLLGGWDIPLKALLLFMVIDFITGLLVAGVFGRSGKSATGALESLAGWRGLCRKGVTLMIILVAHQLDLALEMTVIRDAVVSAYLVVEAVSILENAGLMGVPIPDPLVQAIDLLRRRQDEGDLS